MRRHIAGAMLFAALPAAAQPVRPPLAPPSAERPRFGAFEYSETVIPRAERDMLARGDGVKLALSIGEPGYAISLVDNGAVVAIEVHSTRCGGSMRPLSYQGRVGEPALFGAMLRFTAGLGPACRIEGGGQRALLARIRASRPDFVRGVQHMKARAEAVIGGWRHRCPPQSPTMWSPHNPCR